EATSSVCRPIWWNVPMGDGAAIGSLEDLRVKVRSFATERDWQRFHTPKNLAMAVTVEAAELLEVFQWLSGDEAQAVAAGGPARAAAEAEMADVLIYLVRLADVLGVDLLAAAHDKLQVNAQHYPIGEARG